jgi:tetratricopeptide (TPR) repeat protein
LDRDNGLARDAITEAWSLMSRGNWSAAQQRWQRITERFPENPSGYAGSGAAFREAGDLDQAEEVLAQAFLRFPSSSEVATNYGWVANARRDWDEAVRRWELVRARYPESPSGYAGGGAALRELGRFDEAEIVLLAGMERLPHSADISVTHAGIAGIRRNWPEAVRRWDDVRSRFPSSPSAYIGGAAALRALNRPDEADSLLAAGVELCTTGAEVGLEYARSADQRDDWAEATRRWELVRNRFPDNATARRGADEARQKLRQGEGASSGQSAPDSQPAETLAAAPDDADTLGRSSPLDNEKSSPRRRGQRPAFGSRSAADAQI